MPREVVHDVMQGEVSRRSASAADLIERYGVGGNAEALIAAVREAHDPRLINAGAKRVNESATRELVGGGAFNKLGNFEVENPDYDDVQEIAGTTVESAVVRGRESVVYVATDDQGVHYKGTYELSDPEGTHVSQVEILREGGGPGATAVQSARKQAEEQDARSDELAARERALARREADLKKREAELDPSSAQPEGLPAGYDELKADEAAAAVENASPEERDAIREYETAQSRPRKTVLEALDAAAEQDESSGGD